MKKQKNKIFLFLIIVFLLSSCGEKELKEDAIYDPRMPETEAVMQQADEIEQQVNHIFMQDNRFVELYYQKKSGDETLHAVQNFDNLDKANLRATYNIIRNKDGNIMSVTEFPYCSTGEWENVYSSLYDEHGNLLKFSRVSAFEAKKENTFLVEKSDYFYSSTHELLKKTYTLMDMRTQTQNIDPGKVSEFPYRFSYEKYTTREAWLKAHEIKQ